MTCQIKSNRIYHNGKAVGFRQTRNVGGTIVPTVIVLHDTAGHLHGRDSIDWLLGGPGRSQTSSAHVVIGRDGAITQLADMNRKTWHAGTSSWRGRQQLNGWSIGIEIVNPGGPLKDLGNERFKGVDIIDTNADPSLIVCRGQFPARTPDGKPMAPNDGLWLAHSPQQIEAVVDLCRALVAAYPTITEIVTHWMIAPNRKVDTNPLFPIDVVRNRVFGAAKLSLPAKVAGFADLPEPDDGREDDGVADSPVELDQFEPDAGESALYNDVDEDGLYGDPFPATKPPPEALVKFAQERLRALGYYEVGNVDGQFETRTEDALVTFKRRNGLPPEPTLDQQTVVALASAEPREIGAARATATAKTLKGMPAVKQAGRSKLLAWLLGAPSAAFAAVQGVVANVSGATAQLAPVQSLLGSVPSWAWALLVIFVAFGIWWFARKAEAETVDAYRAGRLT